MHSFPNAPTAAGPEERPFELVRYYSITSLVIIVLFALAVSWVVSEGMVRLVRAKQEQFALLLAENLNHQVMVRFVVPVLRDYGRINVGRPEQFKLLDAVVRNTIHSFHVARLDIEDLEGNIIYSTSPEYISRVGEEGRAFEEAVTGGHFSRLVPPVGVFDWAVATPRYLQLFAPLRDERRRTAELGPPRAVFVITLDVTPDFERIRANQLLVAGILLVMTAVLFVILRSIVSRGQRLMARQAELQARLREELNQARRLASLGRMVAGVAHEIRNPLGIIRSTAELLGRRVEEGAGQLAQVIVEESSRLNQIVSEFLDFARPQQPRPAPTDIPALAGRILKAVEPEAQRLGVELELKASGPAIAMADEQMIYRALMNMLTNALQAMEDGGKVVVEIQRLEEPGRSVVEIAVGDSGPGVAPELAEQVFEPFFTTKDKGTGLGLAIVAAIVRAHGGTVGLTRSDMGGARFVIRIPAAS